MNVKFVLSFEGSLAHDSDTLIPTVAGKDIYLLEAINVETVSSQSQNRIFYLGIYAKSFYFSDEWIDLNSSVLLVDIIP